MQEIIKDPKVNSLIVLGYILIILSWYSYTSIKELQTNLANSQSEVARQAKIISLQSTQLQKIKHYKEYDRVLKDLARHTN
jgi:hypothetical protein